MIILCMVFSYSIYQMIEYFKYRISNKEMKGHMCPLTIFLRESYTCTCKKQYNTYRLEVNVVGDRVILHSDINSCYASIELLHHPELRGKPLAVGGDPEARHGIVLTADYVAKKHGVKTGMALWQARQVCPDITFVPPRMDLYLRFSKMAHEIYGEYTDLQEPYGIDESWLDVTASASIKGDGYKIAHEISNRMKSELGITVNPVITPMTELYEKLDWRDPYVFYNEEDENYWILISARRLDMPVTRRGCIVLYRSKNLKDWTYYGPIYSPGHTNCPECPEMYKMGGHWYLSYSRFSEFVNTIYRVSESPFGPWRKPKKDGIGGRRFYAAKSMQNDNGRRFYFGWAHDRAEQSDKGEWYWGGTFCIPHEVVPTENGELNVKLPCEYEHIFDKAVNWKYISVLGNAKDYGEKTITLNALESCSYGFLRHTEESYMLTCKIVPRETYDTFGILLKSDKEASGCLFLEFDKAMQRVSFLNLPMGVDPFWVQSCQAVPPATEPGPDGVRVCEKTMQIEDGKAIDVKIIVDHDMIEAFIDEQIAFTYRIYAKPEFETGIIAQDSNVEFYNLSISGK